MAEVRTRAPASERLATLEADGRTAARDMAEVRAKIEAIVEALKRIEETLATQRGAGRVSRITREMFQMLAASALSAAVTHWLSTGGPH